MRIGGWRQIAMQGRGGFGIAKLAGGWIKALR
jgi:hypothetical protein